jgi:transporter family-2 protein
MTKSLVVAVALLAGAGLAFQVGFNNTLRAWVGHPIHASLISFASGTLGLLLLACFVRTDLPPISQATKGPWWMWLGGMTGVVYIVSAAALSQRVGSVGWLSLIIAGQIVASLLLDHFGLIGFSSHPINAFRVMGVLFLLVGVFLVLKF